MCAGDLEARGEPEPRAGLRGRERLEQVLANARIDPVARVRDARNRPIAVALEPNRRGASRRQRLLRVDEQAQEDLAQPAGAAVDVERLPAIVLAQLEVLVRVRAADELDGLLGDPVQ